MFLAISSDAWPHFWTSAILYDKMPSVLTPSIWLPKHSTIFTIIAKFSLRQVFRLTIFHSHDSILWCTTSTQSFSLALPMAFAPQSWSQSILELSKNHGDDPVDSMHCHKCYSLTHNLASLWWPTLYSPIVEWCRGQHSHIQYFHLVVNNLLHCWPLLRRTVTVTEQ